MRQLRLIALVFSLVALGHSCRAESLVDYARKCALATGIDVPAFNCMNGTPVPSGHPNGTYPNMTCDTPNRLNRECDPGSRFQILRQNQDAFSVAHCRERGAPTGEFADVAVIQHNKVNGATCFYQALRGGPNAGPQLPAQAPAVAQGEQGYWLSPAGTIAADPCVRCHDNGAIIRSPYLAQLGSAIMPGAGDSQFNNKTHPYHFVGEDFANWKAYSVEVQGNACLSCHRLGVSNLSGLVSGTAIDLGMRATAMSEPQKNPHSAASPIWMPPGQTFFNATNAAAALEIKNCALHVNDNPLPNSASCRIVPYADAFPAGTTALPPVAPTKADMAALVQYLNDLPDGSAIPSTSPPTDLSVTPLPPVAPVRLPPAISHYVTNSP